MNLSDEGQSREPNLKELRDRKNKQSLLDENFRKAEKRINKIYKDPEETIKPKNPLFLFMAIMTVVAVIGLIIINQIPWMYIKYTPHENQNTTIDELFYKNFEHENNQYSQEIDNLFIFKNGSYLLGLSKDDFTETNKQSFYSLTIWIVLGIIFLITTLALKLLKLPFRWIITLKSIFCVIVAVICIYLIFIFIKFASANLLLFHNTQFISSSLHNLSLSFPTPIIIILMMIFALKINFSIIKINYRELSKKPEEDTSEKPSYKYEVKGLS